MLQLRLLFRLYWPMQNTVGGGNSWSWMLALIQQATEPKTWSRDGAGGRRGEATRTIGLHVGH